MQNKPRILVSNGSYKHTLGAVRWLAADGFEVDAIGSRHCICASSRYLHHVAISEDVFNEQGFPEFLSFLKQARYDVFLPISSQAVALAARHIDDLRPHCRVPIAELSKVELCFDKARINAFAANHEVDGPRTWQPSSPTDLEQMLPEIPFPVVVKRLSELGDFPTRYVDHADDLRRLFDSLIQAATPLESWPVIQQRIVGPGEGLFALYDRGVCKRVFMHRRIRELPPTGGASCCAVSIFEDDLKLAGTRLLNALEWHGVAMVEFKRDHNTGKLSLIEINPKFWGSLDLALESGVNFPALAARIALGEDIGYSEQYRVGLKYHWPLNGELKHVSQRPRSLLPVLVDCLNPRVRSNIWLRDLRPALHSLRQQFGAVTGGIVGKQGGHAP